VGGGDSPKIQRIRLLKFGSKAWGQRREAGCCAWATRKGKGEEKAKENVHLEGNVFAVGCS